MGHEGVCRQLLDDLGIDPSIPLQEPEHDAFLSLTPATTAFAAATEISFVQLSISPESLLAMPSSSAT